MSERFSAETAALVSEPPMEKKLVQTKGLQCFAINLSSSIMSSSYRNASVDLIQCAGNGKALETSSFSPGQIWSLAHIFYAVENSR